MRNYINKLWAIVILISIGFTVNAQDRDIPLNEIPEQITKYVSTYFPQNTITKAHFDDHKIYRKYEISLKGKISLEFTPEFKIQEIKSKSKLPDAVIPEEILSYVKTNYPNNVITDWELDDGNQQIELDNGTDIEFNLKGEFLRIDN